MKKYKIDNYGSQQKQENPLIYKILYIYLKFYCEKITTTTTNNDDNHVKHFIL